MQVSCQGWRDECCYMTAEVSYRSLSGSKACYKSLRNWVWTRQFDFLVSASKMQDPGQSLMWMINFRLWSLVSIGGPCIRAQVKMDHDLNEALRDASQTRGLGRQGTRRLKA